jgi:hypothetical protein
LGSIAEDLSTFKAQPFFETATPSKQLLQRFRCLVNNHLLEVVPPNEDIPPNEDLPPNQDLPLESDRVRIRGVIPQLAISMAHAFEDEEDDNALLVELQRQGIVAMPQQALVVANAYYYNELANNVRHESICGVHRQPANGWSVSTTPGGLSCECNYYFKFKFCCHLLYALQVQNKDERGMPQPPANFGTNNTVRIAAAPRFTGQQRLGGAGRNVRRRVGGGGRNVRGQRTVGDPLSLH